MPASPAANSSVRRNPWLRVDGRTITFRQLDRTTNALAHGFLNEGIAPGDHVAVLMENCPECLLSYLALGKMGAVVVPINTAARGQLLKYYLELADCKALLVSGNLAKFVEPVSAELPLLRIVCVLGDIPGELRARAGTSLRLAAFPDTERFSDRAVDVPVKFSDLALLLYTSGTIPGLSFSFSVAAGTPAPIMDKLQSAISQALQQPDVKAQFVKPGYGIIELPPKEAAQRQANMARLFADIAAKSGIKPE